MHLMLKKQNYCTVATMKIFVFMLIYNMKMVKSFCILTSSIANKKDFASGKTKDMSDLKRLAENSKV